MGYMTFFSRRLYPLYLQFFCTKDNEYNDLATIFFNTQVSRFLAVAIMFLSSVFMLLRGGWMGLWVGSDNGSKLVWGSLFRTNGVGLSLPSNVCLPILFLFFKLDDYKNSFTTIISRWLNKTI